MEEALLVIFPTPGTTQPHSKHTIHNKKQKTINTNKTENKKTKTGPNTLSDPIPHPHNNSSVKGINMSPPGIL